MELQLSTEIGPMDLAATNALRGYALPGQHHDVVSARGITRIQRYLLDPEEYVIGLNTKASIEALKEIIDQYNLVFLKKAAESGMEGVEYVSPFDVVVGDPSNPAVCYRYKLEKILAKPEGYTFVVWQNTEYVKAETDFARMRIESDVGQAETEIPVLVGQRTGEALVHQRAVTGMTYMIDRLEISLESNTRLLRLVSVSAELVKEHRSKSSQK